MEIQYFFPVIVTKAVNALVKTTIITAKLVSSTVHTYTNPPRNIYSLSAG